MKTATIEANFSELIQKPKLTLARMSESSDQAVLLRRRGEEDLYLTTQERAEQTREAAAAIGRLMAAILKTEGAEALTAVLPVVFPWVRFLPCDAAREFLTEFVETVEASAELGTLNPVSPLIAAWKSTARIYADPELKARLTQPADGDFGPVPRPDDIEPGAR